MTTIHTGRLGEAAIIAHFVEQGFDIYCPIFGNASCDLVVGSGGRVFRVEVKTTAYERYPGKYEVQLKSVRHNTTETHIKKFDASNSDLLAIYIVPLKKVVILESEQYNGRTTVTLEGTDPAVQHALKA
jgi:hypothetical protein